MSPSRARYVTACQQLLALGVVVMALVPATRVVSLDVVGVQPDEGVAKPSISVSPNQSLADYARGKQHRGNRHQGHRAELSLRVAERGAG
jgi:hypothetical protein